MASPIEETVAKRAYRTGVEIPWEHLNDIERQAWFEVVELLAPEPTELGDDMTCGDCGADLACPVCEIEKFAVVAATTGQTTAVLTQKV